MPNPNQPISTDAPDKALSAVPCSDLPQDCPMCDNSGGYGEAYLNGYGEECVEHVQCEWCWTQPNSKFNHNSND